MTYIHFMALGEYGFADYESSEFWLCRVLNYLYHRLSWFLFWLKTC
jgi:hypothetical protein